MTYGVIPIEITWNGPYAWPGSKSHHDLNPLPRLAGVYLQTFEYRGGYLIYAAGLTRRPVPIRFREHTRKYMNGEYSVLDVAMVKQGIRKEIWHGWGYAREHREEFVAQKATILDAVRQQLAEFRIFVADMGQEPRILERLEASIMISLYQQQSPISDIPDRGMQLSPRWNWEKPIIVKNICTCVLHGIPAFLEI